MNIAVQFSSQIRPTERRDPEASLLKTWAFVACGDKDGIGSDVVAVDSIRFPLGRSTEMAGLVCEVDWVGRLVVEVSRKCPVAPVSALTVVVVGGADIALFSRYDFKVKLHFLTLSRMLF